MKASELEWIEDDEDGGYLRAYIPHRRRKLVEVAWVFDGSHQASYWVRGPDVVGRASLDNNGLHHRTFLRRNGESSSVDGAVKCVERLFSEMWGES